MYVTLDECKEYIKQNYEDTSIKESTLKVAILRASMLIDSNFRDKFIGKRETNTQDFEFPRINCVGSHTKRHYTGIPISIKNATCEIAYFIAKDKIKFFHSELSSEIKREKKKIGDLEKEIEYVSGGSYADIEYQIMNNIKDYFIYDLLKINSFKQFNIVRNL